MAILVDAISKVEDKIFNLEVEIAEAKLQLDKSNLTDSERSLQTFIFKMKYKEKNKLQSQKVSLLSQETSLLSERKLLREVMKENRLNLRAAKDEQATSIDLFLYIPRQ